MTASYLRNILFVFDLLVIFVRCAELNVTGEAVTTRFWDCCKPSCSWTGKAKVSQPVQDCTIDDAPSPDFDGGTGCKEGGKAYTCNNQQPWAVNDTTSYGFAGVFLKGHSVEESWCCACYELTFTSDPIKGKKMIVQASNSAFDVNTVNRFSLAVPGGNTTTSDACARQFGVDQTVFGETNSGVSSSKDCDSLPEKMRAPCRWRFDWLQDAQYPSVNYKRVVCPAELTNITKCIRDDEKLLAAGQTSASTFLTAPSLAASLTMVIASLLLASHR